MDLTKLQLSELMCKHATQGNGLHDLDKFRQKISRLLKR